MKLDSSWYKGLAKLAGVTGKVNKNGFFGISKYKNAVGVTNIIFDALCTDKLNSGYKFSSRDCDYGSQKMGKGYHTNLYIKTKSKDYAVSCCVFEDRYDQVTVFVHGEEVYMP